MIILLDNACETGLNKNWFGEKSHVAEYLPRMQSWQVVKVNTKNVGGHPGGGRDSTTSH